MLNVNNMKGVRSRGSFVNINLDLKHSTIILISNGSGVKSLYVRVSIYTGLEHFFEERIRQRHLVDIG